MTRLTNPTDRRTEARVARYRGVTMYFSYETLIAVSGAMDGHYLCFRRENVWGPTTGRHIHEMGLRGATVVNTEEELEQYLDRMMLHAAAEVADEMVVWRAAA